MPCFKWIGLTTSSAVASGKQFAPSRNDLFHDLARQEIVLVSCSPWQPYAIKSTRKVIASALFSHLGTLLSAQLRLSHALDIIISFMPQRQAIFLVNDLKECVESGISLSAALAYYPNYFNPLTLSLIAVGESSGRLDNACSMLASYDEDKKVFAKKIHDSLIGPVITFVFFIGITLVLFIFIVPYFGTLMHTTGKPIPQATQSLLKVSALLASSAFWQTLTCITIIGYLLFRWTRIFFLGIAETLLLSLPLVGTASANWALATFLKALQLLLAQGVPLVQSLSLARETFPYLSLRWYIDRWIDQVAAGKTLYSAIESCSWGNLCELKALVKIGESSGELADMVGKAGDIYKEKSLKEALFLTHFLQPAFLLLLGGLIGGLVFALYMPLLSFGDTF